MAATLDVAGTDYKMRWDEVAVRWDEGFGMFGCEDVGM